MINLCIGYLVDKQRHSQPTNGRHSSCYCPVVLSRLRWQEMECPGLSLGLHWLVVRLPYLSQKPSRTLVWLGIKCIPLQTNDQIQQITNLYTKEIFQKLPETSTGSRCQLDFPTILRLSMLWGANPCWYLGHLLQSHHYDTKYLFCVDWHSFRLIDTVVIVKTYIYYV